MDLIQLACLNPGLGSPTLPGGVFTWLADLFSDLRASLNHTTIPIHPLSPALLKISFSGTEMGPLDQREYKT